MMNNYLANMSQALQAYSICLICILPTSQFIMIGPLFILTNVTV